VARAVDILKSPFSFLFQRPQKEELIAEYIVREHRSGRDIDSIVQDAYVTNRCSERQVARVLARPEVVHALREDATRIS
jgi:hypothetical protein